MYSTEQPNKTTLLVGRSLLIAGAFALATPGVAQGTIQPDRAGLPEAVEASSQPIPQGLDIPTAEADQMRGGGKIKIALVIVKQGKNKAYKFISCFSTTDCRNAAFARFGRALVEQIFWSSTLTGVQKLACQAGIRKFC